jgi:hypothetical protein
VNGLFAPVFYVYANIKERFSAQFLFATKHLPNFKLFELVKKVYEIAPGVLTEHGKTKSK